MFEPNSVLGRSNRFALKFSTKIICHYENIKNFTEKYNQIYNDYVDSREISNFNFSDKSLSFKKYTQVFETKHGFKENLSMLDLLFNYGSNYFNFLIK